MPRLLDRSIHTAVARDGLPRVADYDDGSQHVLYLADAPLPQSLPVADWLGPLPADPTPKESAAAIQARAADVEERHGRRRALHERVRVLAGQTPAQWGIDELRDILALLLMERGWLDGDVLKGYSD